MKNSSKNTNAGGALNMKPIYKIFTSFLLVGVILFFSGCSKSSKKSTFSNPLPDDGYSYSDPWVIQTGGNYYYCGSYNGNSIIIKKSPTLQNILNAQNEVVYTAQAGLPYSQDIWAPELHYLNGRWYIYFAADDGDNNNHRMYCLEGGTNANDPLESPYVFKAQIKAKTDRWAIDGSPFVFNNQLYFVWSGWEGTVNYMQSLYIAKMDNPYSISGDRVKISDPENSWELNGMPAVNEGPEALIHNGNLCIIYSASGSWTNDYCLGQLKLTGTDLLNKSSWEKKSTPVFQKTDKVFGPGHASFVKSPDGKEDWIVYHAAKKKGSGWVRDIRIQKFTWNTDNTPNFGKPVDPGVLLAVPSGSKN